MKTFLKTLLITGVIAGTAATDASGQMALSGKLALSSASKVWFDGTSNVKSFSCVAKKLDLDIVSDADAGPARIVKSASLSIPVAQLDCKNGKMNEHMGKALKADKFSAIVWKLSSYRLDGAAVLMDGMLTIAGKESPMQLRGIGGLDNGTIKVKGTKVFNMTQFGVKPPSLMFGTMKVADPITVSFDIVLNQH